MTNDPLPFLAISDEIPGITVVAILLPIVLVIGWTVYKSIRGRRRQTAIAAVVAANAFTYVAEEPSRVDAFKGFPFGIGGERRVYDVVRGTHAGQAFESFAYSYVTTHKDSDGHTSRTTHHHQVTWISLAAPFPEVRLVPHSQVERHLFGNGPDLNTESAEFNRRWLVRASDDRIAHAILSGLMIERLLLEDVAEMILVFEGSALLTFTFGESELATLLPVVESLRDVAAKVPAFLFDEFAPREGS